MMAVLLAAPLPWRDVAVAGVFCAQVADGTLICPVRGAPPPAVPFRRFAVGDRYGCGIRENRTLACRGEAPSYAPPPGRFRDLDVNGDWTCAVRDDGGLVCFDAPDPAAPPPALPAGPFERVRLAGRGGCALRADGEAVCWGEVPAPPPGPWADLAPPCGLRRGGPLHCWAGDVDPPTGRFVALGGQCALRADGSGACWGQARPPPFFDRLRFARLAAHGSQLGGVTRDGRLVYASDDTALEPVTRVEATHGGVCGLTADGALTCRTPLAGRADLRPDARRRIESGASLPRRAPMRRRCPGGAPRHAPPVGRLPRREGPDRLRAPRSMPPSGRRRPRHPAVAEAHAPR